LEAETPRRKARLFLDTPNLSHNHPLTLRSNNPGFRSKNPGFRSKNPGFRSSFLSFWSKN
jgi:hypothetical protein